MKRSTAILLACFSALSAVYGSVSVAAGSTAPRERLRDFICQRAVAQAQRTISIEAVMRPVANTKKMAIRFDLLSKAKNAAGYSAVRSGDLGVWRTPTDPPTLGQRANDLWMISHTVTGLPAPVTYRYRVTFRWSGEHGRVLATRTLLSGKCFEPELRPDLMVASITVAAVPGHPKQNAYTALIRNQGATTAGRFDVVFAPGGPMAQGGSPALKTHTIQQLAAHASRQVTFLGPACTAATAPTISVDPAHQVDDFNTANNSMVASCPATVAGS